MKQHIQEMHVHVDAFEAIYSGAKIRPPTRQQVLESLELAAAPGKRSLVSQDIPGGVLEQSINPLGWGERMASLGSQEVLHFVTETGVAGTRKDLEDRLQNNCNGIGFAEVIHACLFEDDGARRQAIRKLPLQDRLRIVETLEVLAREHERAATRRMHNHEGPSERPDHIVANVLCTAGLLRCMSRGVTMGWYPERLE